MKILTFAASSSQNSINKQLAIYAASLVEGAEIEILDINDYEMPLFSTDRENDLGQPDLAKKFRAKIGEADALIVSFAEHNGTYSAAYKNLFDWTSRIDRNIFQDKPTVYLATSPGPGGAATVLAQATVSAPFFGVDLKANVSVPKFFDAFDSETGEITDDEIKRHLKEAVSKL